MTDRKAMEQALEALKFYYDQHGEESDEKVITALRERLAQPEQPSDLDWWKARAIQAERLVDKFGQPEQEPVANIRIWHKNGEQHAELWNWDKGIEALSDGNYDLYIHPPQRKPEREPIKESSITHGHLWIGDLYGKEKNT